MRDYLDRSRTQRRAGVALVVALSIFGCAGGTQDAAKPDEAGDTSAQADTSAEADTTAEDSPVGDAGGENDAGPPDATGCPAGDPCDDGDPCTAKDLCKDDLCVGSGDACDDGNECTADECSPDDGSCLHLKKPLAGNPCEDGIACTDSHCKEGKCTLSLSWCECLSVADCIKARGNDPCVGDWQCNANKCHLDESAKIVCDSKNDTMCSINTCSLAGTCKMIKQYKCDDGSLCTMNDWCKDDLTCSGEKVTCGEDGSPCTWELCDPKQGCTFSTTTIVSTVDYNGSPDGAKVKLPEVGGIAAHGVSTLWITAPTENRIYLIKTGTNWPFPLQAASYAGSTSGFQDGPAWEAKFNQPRGICSYTKDYPLVVVDTGNHAIRHIYNDVETVAGDGTAGAADGPKGKGRLNSPTACIADFVRALIVDTGNHRIRSVKLDGTGTLTTVAGSDAGFKDGIGSVAKFNAPQGIADSWHKDWSIIADTGNHAIRKVNNAGSVITLAGGTLGLKDGPGSQAQFSSPQGVSFGTAHIYVADTGNHRIRRVDQDGTVTTVAGGSVGFKDGPADLALFDAPVAIDSRFVDNMSLFNPTIFVAEAKTGQLRAVHIKLGAPCNDSDPCTTGELCSTGGACAGGGPTDCDDGNQCTSHWCDKAGGCATGNVADGLVCVDGDPCTLGACKAGSCKQEAIICNDGNSCTYDSCESLLGNCVFKATLENCDDGDACTLNDKCAGGKCLGVEKSCDDGKVCTADSCDAAKGCKYKLTTCDDGVPCTADTCDEEKGCVASAVTGPACDSDGTKCTPEVCNKGTCEKAGPASCAGNCCDDGQSCTTDSCDASTGACSYKKAADGAACDDGDACTQGDACMAGACKAVGKVCVAPEVCAAGACVPATTDGMALIPAGNFTMGCVPLDYWICQPDEKSPHTVWVDAFYIDTHEVTAAEYKECVTAGKCKAPFIEPSSTYGVAGKEQHPMIDVNWLNADAYCKWTHPKGRLPTEAEWEKAGRGGLKERRYPWGDTLTCDHAVWKADSNKSGCEGTVPLAVGSKPVGENAYGLFDMTGNVAEWVHDWYAEKYYETGPATNPKGPETGSKRVVRGGDFSIATPWYLSLSVRRKGTPEDTYFDVGFRCARSLP